jgi:small subunit ribosomal protein S8e
VTKKLAGRALKQNVEQHVAEQFSSGRLFAAISSRPGQSGRADGYILEGKELEFYQRKFSKKHAAKK